MDYYESAEDIIISQSRAKKEIEKHGANWDDFIEECGEKADYDAQFVLRWLGY